jgi:hypothetical protein
MMEMQSPYIGNQQISGESAALRQSLIGFDLI